MLNYKCSKDYCEFLSILKRRIYILYFKANQRRKDFWELMELLLQHIPTEVSGHRWYGRGWHSYEILSFFFFSSGICWHCWKYLTETSPWDTTEVGDFILNSHISSFSSFCHLRYLWVLFTVNVDHPGGSLK